MTGRDSAVLFSLSLAQFTTTLEFTIVFVALPSIGDDLSLGAGQLQWVVGAYAVLFGGFLILCGRLSDRFGARRLFLVATVLFGLTSAAGAVAETAVVLLAARAGQGLAAAMLQPAVLGLLQSVFRDEPLRGRAWAVWSAIGASGLGLGALLGGVLTEWSWRLTFAINVPLMAACALGALVWMPPGPARSPVRIPLRRPGSPSARPCRFRLVSPWRPIRAGALPSCTSASSRPVCSEPFSSVENGAVR
ncbi:Major Facilitator Superfamily protein [Prauserella marina]|uniref:Major Facilitator Superfamily protein n=1 Tax=Prauserella marina TaxID=530584 RepID=A0A1G6XIN1_9PSEU|nr:MFS transporter [Prauserella marina]PWV72521.1 MFS transporter [Prauserella marina]SDD78058.1 Major Facilitator Superfamily protein [Prauserella marina]